MLLVLVWLVGCEFPAFTTDIIEVDLCGTNGSFYDFKYDDKRVCHMRMDGLVEIPCDVVDYCRKVLELRKAER